MRMLETWGPLVLGAMLAVLALMGVALHKLPFEAELRAAHGWVADGMNRLAASLIEPAIGFLRWAQLYPTNELGIVGDVAFAQKRSDLAALFAELQQGEKDMADAAKEGKAFDRAKGEALEAKAQEAETLQAEIDRYDRIAGLAAKGREIPDPVLPADKGEQKTQTSGVAGYMTLGDYVLASPSFQAFHRSNYSTGSHALIEVEGLSLLGKNMRATERGEPLVPLTPQMRKAFEAALQAKAVPVLGTGLLEPERIARIPQVTADDRLGFTDVIATGTTGAGSVEYVREESHTQAAAETAHGAVKPEEALEYSVQTAAVRTIAGHMPVQNQQIEDWPQLRSLIEGRLRYSVRRRREYQIAWGSGSGANLEGLLTVAGTTDIAANGRFNQTAYDAGDQTLIDVVRMGITDVMVNGYEPNFLAIHPFDWESIILQKGTDNHYVWIIVTDANGSRLWSLRVVETVAMQERAGVATERRELIVGDGQMGAQILDRQQLTVVVGLINDQLVRNMRTILAEERLAFPIYAPAAFAHFETQASAT